MARSNCPQCAAPVHGSANVCQACGVDLPSWLEDESAREAAAALLKSLDDDLIAASSVRLNLAMLATMIVPPGLAIAGWQSGYVIAGLGAALGVGLALLILIGFESDRAAEIHFEAHTKQRLQELAEETGASDNELTVLASQFLPAGSALRRFVTRL